MHQDHSQRFRAALPFLLAASTPFAHSSALAQDVTDITYTSSVDGESLTSRLFLPTGFDPSGPPVALVCHLHGAGGVGSFTPAMRSQLDGRGWIGIAPDGRPFEAGGSDCSWPFSPAYFDSPDPAVGPGEQDILDAIDWALAQYPVDLERIYLTGFSYGGRGTYMIGLKNPDRFAAIAPTGAPTDMYEIDVRRPDTEGCRLALLGGVPGDSPEIDTLFTTTSGRFLLENAYNLPVFHGHGLFDDVASNTLSEAPYLHGWHVTVANGWDACHSPALCFGHTPTLSELAALHPGGYDWAFQFTPVGHVPDPRWLSGTPNAPGLFGTEDPLAPGQLLGIFDFFERRTLEHSPETVVFKTYEADHRKAYWLELLTATPWIDTPACVRASRDVAGNSLAIELVRAAEVRIDVAAAQLALDLGSPLSIELSELIEPAYDPALAAPGEDWDPVLQLAGIEGVVGATVLLDGDPMPAAQVLAQGGTLQLGPIDISTPRTLLVYPYVQVCEGLPNSSGGSANLMPEGSAVLADNDLVLGATSGPPGQFGVFFYGFGAADVPLGDGRLCVAPALFRLPTVVLLDGAGSVSLAVDATQPPVSAGPGQLLVGETARFQLWFRDPGGTLGSNTSNAVELQFL